ncbi:MAG: 50S ribosomal protein L29 [Planctomycetaceae bacterium]
MSKPAELRELNEEQLMFTLKQAQKELFELQFQSATEKLDTPSRKQLLRREIARIKTIQRERSQPAEVQA